MPLGEKALALPECQVFRGSGAPGDVCFVAAGGTGTGLPFRVTGNDLLAGSSAHVSVVKTDFLRERLILCLIPS